MSDLSWHVQIYKNITNKLNTCICFKTIRYEIVAMYFLLFFIVKKKTMIIYNNNIIVNQELLLNSKNDTNNRINWVLYIPVQNAHSGNYHHTSFDNWEEKAELYCKYPEKKIYWNINSYWKINLLYLNVAGKYSSSTVWYETPAFWGVRDRCICKASHCI